MTLLFQDGSLLFQNILLFGGPECCCEGGGSGSGSFTPITTCPDSISGCPGTQITITFPAPHAAYGFTVPVTNGWGFYSDADHWETCTIVVYCIMVSGVPCWQMSIGGYIKVDGFLYDYSANPNGNYGCGLPCPPLGSYNMLAPGWPPDGTISIPVVGVFA